MSLWHIFVSKAIVRKLLFWYTLIRADWGLLDSPIKGFPEKKSEQSYVVVAVIYAT